MSGFVVDSRTLVAVQQTLGRLQDQLTGMHSDIHQQWGTLGGRALESELERFCGTWHYGVTELGDQLGDLTRRLGEAAAAYERIEQRITHAAGGSSSGRSPTGGAKGSTHATSTGTSYSGGAGLTGPTNHGSRSGGAKRSTDHGHDHDGGATHHGNAGSGSGTTVIGGGGNGGSHGGGDKHPGSGSGSGTTVIGGGSSTGGGPAKGGGSGTTTIDEKIHHAEDRQRAELAAILKTVQK
jgi:hypothetical protein